ncbi:TonB-dependent receptor [Chitinophaga sancti]|uniref:TonB-dependent receptor n=1 Tax=Chitinophaga sancti TaxID=1004 RepID=UPI002A74901C|nr:TonB-dependent receptor [Chitinophaga sancti]WPQ60114.1 TonB-dependent receptor [Chitinophaga sancti]
MVRIVSFGLCLLLFSNIYAQEKDTMNRVELKPVIITAEKREGSLQKTPLSVSALTGAQLERSKTVEMGDLLLQVPNLMAMNVGAPTLSTISIRGIMTFSVDPAVGVYIDGIPMFDGYSSSIRLNDIERVEVLRGPQSTLYGRNALGGIINIFTCQPGDTLRGFAEAGFGKYASQHYGLSISGPIVKHKLLAGFSGMYDTRNGYYTNLYTNSKYDRPEIFGGNAYLKYLASDRLSFTFNLKEEQDNVSGAFPYVLGVENALANPYKINQNGTNQETRKLYTGSLLAEYKTHGATFSSITGYTYLSDTYRNYDADYSVYDMITYSTPMNDQMTWTEELKVVTAADRKLQFTGGLFGFIDRKHSQTVYTYGDDYALYDPTAPYTTNIYGDKHIYGAAAYAHLTYAISPKWKVSGGLRYDIEKRDLVTSTDYVKDGSAPVVISPEQKLKGDNNAFSPKLSLSYMPANNVLVYATYSKGYRTGGFNQYTTDVTKLNYKPEYTDNFELGFKSEWFHHRFRANVAVFYTNWRDQQQTLSLPVVAIQNVGKMENKGADIELTGIPVKGLEVSYDLGVVSSEFKALILPDENSENKDYKGNKQVFTPAFTSSLAFTYTYDFGHRWSLFVRPEWKLLGKQYMTYYNDLVQDPFSLINAMVGVKYARFELSGWGKNLGNVKYISYAYATQTKENTPLLLGTPLTYGVSLKTRF